RQPVNEWRRELLHLPPLSGGPLARQLDDRRLPILYGYSPAVLPKPPDWDERTHVTGYWFLDHLPDWRPPEGLVDFLRVGPPPVSVGFGSMRSQHPEAVTELVVEALARAGQRGILLTGWGGLRGIDRPERVFTVEAVPHDWLFPQVRAAVHHGGAGTAAAALRAGIPSVVVPFFGDQSFWGRRVAALGAGTKPISQ